MADRVRTSYDSSKDNLSKVADLDPMFALAAKHPYLQNPEPVVEPRKTVIRQAAPTPPTPYANFLIGS